MATKRTYRPSKKRRAKTFGYRVRSRSAKGRKVIKRRALKGRKKLTP